MSQASVSVSRIFTHGVSCILALVLAFAVIPDPSGFSGPGPWLPAGIVLGFLLASGPIALPFALFGLLIGAAAFVPPVWGGSRYLWAFAVCGVCFLVERFLWVPKRLGVGALARVVFLSLLTGAFLACAGLCFTILTQPFEPLTLERVLAVLPQTQILGALLAAPLVYEVVRDGFRSTVAHDLLLPELAVQGLLLAACCWLAMTGDAWVWPVLVLPVLWVALRHSVAAANLCVVVLVISFTYNTEYVRVLSPALRSSLPVEFMLALIATGLGLYFSLRRQRRILVEERLRRIDTFLDSGAACLWEWIAGQGLVFTGGWAQLCACPSDASLMDDSYWRGLVHPQDLQRVLDLREQHRLGALPIYEAQFRLRTVSGLYRPVRETGLVVEWDESGRAQRMIGFCVDSPAAATATAEAGTRALSIIGEPLFLCDAHGNVLHTNPAAEALHAGRPTTRAVPLHVVDFLSEESGRLLLREGFVVAREQGAWRGAVSATTAQESASPEMLVWADKPYSGEPRGYVVQLRKPSKEQVARPPDVAEHFVRHESLRAFAGGVVHTFNNVLMAVMGNAVLARKGIDKASSSAHFLVQIDQAIQKGTQFCQSLQLCAGRVSPSLSNMDLNNLVQRVAPLVGRELGCADYLVLERSQGLPEFESDPALLERALGHLLHNAQEAYAGAHSPIHVRTGQMEINPVTFSSPAPLGVLSAGTYAYIEVLDFGPGLEPSLLARAFDPFFSTKSGHKGLGLAEVAGVARSLGGALQVETSPGRGWRIRLLVPLKKTRSAPALRSSSSGVPWRGSGAVLVIDDDDNVRSLAASMLEHLGFVPLVAAGGAEGLRILATHGSTPRVVLLDYSMPGMDGEATLAEIARLRPALPVVFMSGHAEGDLMAKVGGGQVAGALGKPFALDKLQAVLRAVLEEPR